MLWIEKHKPMSFEDWIGNNEQFIRLKNEIVNYKKKPILLYGSTGTGKTAALHLISRILGYKLLEVNTDEISNEVLFNDILEKSKITYDLFGKKKVIIVDGLELLSSSHIKNLEKLIEVSKSPIVLICYDPWIPKLRPIKQKSISIEFKPLSNEEIKKKLLMICKKEEILISKDVLDSIVKRSKGDMRAAIIDLQSLYYNNFEIEKDVMGVREKEINIFSYLSSLFKDDINESLENFFYVDKQVDELFYWIAENFVISSDLNGYKYISKADIFRSRISKTQYWRFLNYVRLMLVLSAKVFSKNKQWIKFSYPLKFSLLGKFRNRRYIISCILENLSNYTHTSAQKLSSLLPYLSIISRKYDLQLDIKETKLLNSLLR